MSTYNRKGFTTIPSRAKDGTIVAFPARKGGGLDGQRKHRIRKAKREATKTWREYKANLREVKKRVPLAERAKVNLSRLPEKYL